MISYKLGAIHHLSFFSNINFLRKGTIINSFFLHKCCKFFRFPWQFIFFHTSLWSVICTLYNIFSGKVNNLKFFLLQGKVTDELYYLMKMHIQVFVFFFLLICYLGQFEIFYKITLSIINVYLWSYKLYWISI